MASVTVTELARTIVLTWMVLSASAGGLIVLGVLVEALFFRRRDTIEDWGPLLVLGIAWFLNVILEWAVTANLFATVLK